MTVELIRENLKMLEQNLGNFNAYSLQFLDVEDIRAKISIWRWYISHAYFEKGVPRPEFPASNPPVPWLHSQLQGLSVPLHRDIHSCTEPVVTSFLHTEGAARRIAQRMNMIYGYVSPEDAKKDQEQAFERNIGDPKRRKAHAEAQARLRAREKAEKNHRTPEQLQKLGEEYLKKKNKQRAQFQKQEAEKLKTEQERYLAEGKRLKNRGIQA